MLARGTVRGCKDRGGFEPYFGVETSIFSNYLVLSRSTLMSCSVMSRFGASRDSRQGQAWVGRLALNGG